MTEQITKDTVPEIWFKVQRVLRTAVAVILSGAATFAATVLTIQVFAPDIFEQLARVLPSSWVAWLTTAFAFLVVVASVITRIFAIPGVNAWLTKLGLGAVPKSAIEGDGSVKTDPKVPTAEPAYDGAMVINHADPMKDNFRLEVDLTAQELAARNQITLKIDDQTMKDQALGD